MTDPEIDALRRLKFKAPPPQAPSSSSIAVPKASGLKEYLAEFENAIKKENEDIELPPVAEVFVSK